MSKHRDRNAFSGPPCRTCPNCGRKGLSHVKDYFHRCRFCGATIVAEASDKDYPAVTLTSM